MMRVYLYDGQKRILNVGHYEVRFQPRSPHSKMSGWYSGYRDSGHAIISAEGIIGFGYCLSHPQIKDLFTGIIKFEQYMHNDPTRTSFITDCHCKLDSHLHEDLVSWMLELSKDSEVAGPFMDWLLENNLGEWANDVNYKYKILPGVS
jgi:hypothetical protein